MRYLGIVSIIGVASCLADSTQPPSAISLEVLEGDGAIVNIRERHVQGPRIRVLDSAGRPVPGAAITFRLPDGGPSARFESGSASGPLFTLTTSENGEASAGRLKPNSQLGSWQIRVSAAHRGQVVRAAIQLTNAAPVEAFASVSSGKRSRSLYWLAAVGAGVAAAATSLGWVRSPGSPAGAASVASLTGASPASPPALSITAGSGSISAP